MNGLKVRKVLVPRIFAAVSVFAMCLSTSPLLFAQTDSPITSLENFDPKTGGFRFANYGNDNKHPWADDLGADDLIRLVGEEATCVKGTAGRTCKMDASPETWLREKLKAIDKGRCTGMAVASLRFNNGQGFKGRGSLAAFQPGSRAVFDLNLNSAIENYLAYYWLTQVFPEVWKLKDQTARQGPVQIAKTLTDAIENEGDDYTLTIAKWDRGRLFDVHEFTPFAVEELDVRYKIHVYDNNFPGDTRYLYINKDDAQNWSYSSAKTQNAKPDYVGNKNTETLSLTANSWRDGKCFKPMFAANARGTTGCGRSTGQITDPRTYFVNASFSRQVSQEEVEFFLTGEGDMLVNDGGRRIGYDAKADRYFNEIPGALDDMMVGGLGYDLPRFVLAYSESDDPYVVTFSGRHLSSESMMDFVFSGPGFTVGFENIRLDPNETLSAEISRDGEEITFTSSADGETPDVFYAFDADDEGEVASYYTEVGGILLDAGKSLTYNFDFDNGKLYFSDNDGNEDSYDIYLRRIKAGGAEQVFQQNDLDIGKSDNYEMNFGEWDGQDDDMCFRDDDDADGFSDEACDSPDN